MDNLKIIIAGPGAGKTFSLKGEVINCIPNLQKHRFCAVITYTNAATEELRKRISLSMPLQPNIFIGTIHSFLIRFIIEPFGHLVGIGIVPLEKNYIDQPLVELHENYGQVTQAALKTIIGIDKAAAKEIVDFLKRNKFCSNKGIMYRCFKVNDDNFRINLPPKYLTMEKEIINKIKEACVFNSKDRIFAEKRISTNRAEVMATSGFVSYDSVIGIARKIVTNYPSTVNTIARRVQFIFIDEYQDSRLYIHDIFKAILSKKLTSVNCFGDPLQAVFMFSYRKSHLKDEKEPDKYFNTPMKELQMANACRVDAKRTNHRSSENIVALLNQFILEPHHKQISQAGYNGIPIYFIQEQKPSEIYSAYKQLKLKHNVDSIHSGNLRKSSKPLKDLFLTSEWIDNQRSRRPKLKDVYNVIQEDVARLEKGNHRVNGMLQEVSRCILSAVGAKKQQFIKSAYDEIEYRKFCLSIARGVRTEHFNDADRINFVRRRVREKYAIDNDSEKQGDVLQTLFDLSADTSMHGSCSVESCYSSIHGAKGLEATSVLVIAYSKNELGKWLNVQEANEHKDDPYRLGYVAFSRARDMLCIACLEEIPNEMRGKLESLRVVLSPSTGEQ